jgi:hypothetical protein
VKRFYESLELIENVIQIEAESQVVHRQLQSPSIWIGRRSEPLSNNRELVTTTMTRIAFASPAAESPTSGR